MKFFGAGGAGSLVLTRELNQSVIIRKKDDPNWMVKITLNKADYDGRAAVIVVGASTVVAKTAATVKPFGALRMVEVRDFGDFIVNDEITIGIRCNKLNRARLNFRADRVYRIQREEIDTP